MRTKGLRPRQGEVRGEIQSQRKAAASQSLKHPRTDADVQQGQYELKLGEVCTTIPTIDFHVETVETVEHKNLSFTVQKDTEAIPREIKGATKINCFLKENQSEFSEKTSTEGFGEETLRNADHPDSSDAATQTVQKTVKIPQVRDRERGDAFSQLEADVCDDVAE